MWEKDSIPGSVGKDGNTREEYRLKGVEYYIELNGWQHLGEWVLGREELPPYEEVIASAGTMVEEVKMKALEILLQKAKERYELLDAFIKAYKDERR